MKRKEKNRFSPDQKKVLFTLLGLSIIYFCIFIYPNYHRGESPSLWSLFSQDEYVIYPYLMHMMAPTSDIHAIWGNLINYFYIFYGFPYSFLSVLVLLPVKLFSGANFYPNPQLNIFILRQFINVIPITLAAGVLVYFQTRFKGFWKSVLLFIFLLSIPEIFRSNIRWWHPDSLSLLSIALTFLLLVIDQYELKAGFYLAAFTCGMAISIKMIGAFFFLTVPLYLFLTWMVKKTSLKKIALAALLFVFIMGFTFLITNPFLFYQAPRDNWWNIQQSKTGELALGYTHDNPYYYQKGLEFWKWTVDNFFGQYWFIAFLVLSVIVGCLWGEHKLQNRLLLAWLVPLGIYLTYFVAPKPSHYLSPFMLPLFSSVFTLPEIIPIVLKSEKKWVKTGQFIVMTIVVLIIAQQFIFHFSNDFVQLTTINFY